MSGKIPTSEGLRKAIFKCEVLNARPLLELNDGGRRHNGR
jgi:hypothetical protein